MRWNWQLPDWPTFTWRPERLAEAEERFLVSGGLVLGSLEHLDEDRRAGLRVEILGDDALGTSEIEGELLDRDSVQSSIRRALGMQPVPGARPRPAEEGVAEMVVDLHAAFDRDLDQARLGRWHELVMRGRTDLDTIGDYRRGPRPMQVVSGRLDAPTVHFEAPPSSRVPAEMDRFLYWLARTAPGEPAALPPVTRAGLAHVHFECIHPFEDGNGRIGRAISEQALARGIGAPVPTALSVTILRRRREYYDVLQRAGRTLDADEWMAWFAGVALEAQARTLAHVRFIIRKARLLEGLAGRLNQRQQKVMRRVLDEGPDGFEGGLTAGKYLRMTRTSPATARRDLGELVELGALSRTGERRHTRYHLTIPSEPTPRVTIDVAGRVVLGDGEAPPVSR